MLNSNTFHPDELEKVPEPKFPAVLKSGGPILDVLDVDKDGIALVSWDNQTATFPIVCLYRAEPFVS